MTEEFGVALDPEDYLLLTTRVHIMRFQGKDEDGHRWWRLACGSRHTDLDATWVSPEDATRLDLALCGNCARTSAGLSGSREAPDGR